MNLSSNGDYLYWWAWPPLRRIGLIERYLKYRFTYRALWTTRGLETRERSETPETTIAAMQMARTSVGWMPLPEIVAGWMELEQADPAFGELVELDRMPVPGTIVTNEQRAATQTLVIIALQMYRVQAAEMLHLSITTFDRRPHNPKNQNS